MNIIKKHTTVKNSRKEEYDMPQQLDLLKKWTIPKIQIKVIYQMGTFEKMQFKQIVKTTKETITMNFVHGTFRLLSESDFAPYRENYRFMHIGLVQVTFKSLTLRGLPESFIAALRDGRNQNWKKSLIGTVQTSLAYPNLQIYLNDENSLNTLILSIKLHGYDYLPGTEAICICYRTYYKPLYTLNPMCKIMNFKIETMLIETNFSKAKVITRRPIKWDEIDFPKEWVIEETVPSKNNINPNIFYIEQTPDGTVRIKFTDQNLLMSYIDNIDFPSRMLRSNSSYICPVDYIVDMPSRASTSHIRKEDNSRVSTSYMKEGKRVDNIKIENHLVTPDMDPTLSEMDFPNEQDYKLSNGTITKSLIPPQQSLQIEKDNKIVHFTAFAKLFDDNNTALITSKHSKIPDKGKEKATPTIQPPPEIKDFKLSKLDNIERLLQERFQRLNINPLQLSENDIPDRNNIPDEINKISEKHARKSVQMMYYFPRQIYTLAHRILMCSTICKANKNSEKDIANMIIAEFTCQLRGWWDNYLSKSQRRAILNVVKNENGIIPNVVYTLVLTIIEHFSGRWSDNSETIRTMLQNHRCKTLTSFKWYKDIFLSRKGLGNPLEEMGVSINYDDYTYEKRISVCTQEGLSLCNKIKLNQQIKRYHLNEKQQLGKFCDQFAIDMPESSKRSNRHIGKKDYKEKPHRQYIKKKCLDKREKRKMNYKGKKEFYKNNKSNVCHNPNSSDGEESFTSEDLKVLHDEDYISSSEEECTSCQIGQPYDNKDKDKFYQLYSQFKDLNINVKSNDNWVEMLRMIDDPTLRSQIIDKICNTNTSTSNTRISRENPVHNNAYTMAEVKRHLKLRSQRDHIPTTTQDLVEEINNLKKKISSLKNHNMILDGRITYIENKNNNHREKQVMVERNLPDIPEGNLPDIPNEFTDNKNLFLETIELVTAHKLGRGKEPMGRNNILAQIGNQKLIALNIAEAYTSTSGINTEHPMYKKFMNFIQSRQIMTRYFDTSSYVIPTYKYIMHYEIILSYIGSAEFQHFYPTNTKKEYKKLYVEWVDVSPKLIKLQKDDTYFKGMSLMYFFIEFSIPWIMKWAIEVQMNEEGFPCLRRKFHTKFWSKLLQR
ncbi:hypothetical protein H5410_056903 [Solanum commersonii]|uniref:DUF7746 domain-containing protein n=1 Tax=Solanum commersonii TaxID=4109 RepID=A0A9J5WLH1_SOLCO|nr:hypothetical protein H5410_056903 [Solanum commersonii]